MHAATFPSDFIWGVATASYQIEGAWNVDGKGESIWDRFCHSPGNVHNNETGDTACDHYHRWHEDIALMKSLGIQAYRFSLSWPRVLPEGRGRINQAGLDFYSALVDGLLEAGIEPCITLYHWDLPQALQDQGGWPARPTAEAFVAYTDLVSRRLGDRVRTWMTLNEPFVSAYVGHLEGRHAPGHKDVDEMLSASHHLLLAHGWAVPVIRTHAPDSKVGIVLNLNPIYPASPSEADAEEAKLRDGVINRWYLDPLSGRAYPEVVRRYYGGPMRFVLPEDMDAIAAPLDFLGVNYYTRIIARNREIPEEDNAPRTLHPGQEFTEMGWEVYPQGLFEVLDDVHKNYTFPALMITENGAAFSDQLDENSRIEDPERVRYLSAHLLEAARAIEHGIPLHAYFIWTFTDNFEWAYGFTKRFGLVYVDFSSLKRTPKRSAHWYKEVIMNNSVPGELPTGQGRG